MFAICKTELLFLLSRSSRFQLLRMAHSRFFEPNCAFIDGKWVSADSGAIFEVTNPANGKVGGALFLLDIQYFDSKTY